MYDLRIFKSVYKVFHYEVPIHFSQCMNAFNLMIHVKLTNLGIKLREYNIGTMVFIHSLAENNLLFDGIMSI